MSKPGPADFRGKNELKAFFGILENPQTKSLPALRRDDSFSPTQALCLPKLKVP